jgi:copper ion binding protein
MSDTRTYDVPAISCGHCKSAIEGEVSQVDGVSTVNVDIDARRVTVEGQAADAAIRAAIVEAGYEVAAP